MKTAHHWNLPDASKMYDWNEINNGWKKYEVLFYEEYT